VNEARAIFKNTAALAGARLLDRLGNLALAVFIARELGASGLGIYSTAIAYFALIAIAGDVGATNLLIREIAKDRSRTNAYLVHAGALATALGGAIMGLAWLVLPLLGYSADLRAGVEVVILAVIPGTLKTIQEAVFVAHQRVELVTGVTLVASLATVAASFSLLALGHGVVSLLVAFAAIQWGIALVYLGLIDRAIARVRLEFDRSFARRFIREVKAFAASSVLAGMFSRPEIVVLSLLASERQVGLYAAALKVVDLWQFIPQTFMTNVFPVLSRSFHLRDGRARDIQDFALKALLAIGLPLSAGLALAADPIVDKLYGSRFDDAALLLRILAVNVSIYCVHSVLWRVLAARGEQGAVLRVQVVTIAPRLAGGSMLIASLGALGAAVATPAALLLHTALLALSVRRDGTPVRVVRLVWRAALAAAVMGLVVALLAQAVDVWALVPVAAVVYGIVSIAVKAFSARELALVRQALPLPLVRSHSRT
jgi:O-antigen/teichoic acid export membrane protein